MKRLIILTGPTASGKSKVCDMLSARKSCRIINCDSKQVYEGVPTITDQPQKNCLHLRLYGYVSPTINYSVKLWLDDATKEIHDAFSNGLSPILTGGTGMYINSVLFGMSELPEIDDEIREETRALLEKVGNEKFYEMLVDLDPNAHKLHKNNTYRLIRAFETIKQTGISIYTWREKTRPKGKAFYDYRICVLLPERSELYRKIDERFLTMMDSDAVSEVQYLMSLKIPENMPIMKAHGVPEIREYLAGELSLADAISRAQKNTRHFAKRQETWFRTQLPQDRLFFRSHEEAVSYISSIL